MFDREGEGSLLPFLVFCLEIDVGAIFNECLQAILHRYVSCCPIDYKNRSLTKLYWLLFIHTR